jgi:hypothetical protein
METNTYNLEKLVIRLEKIGIKIRIGSNYPWVYLHTVDGNRVDEIFCSEHYFCIGLMPMKLGQFKFNNLSEIFKVIRKYKKNATNN